MSTLEFKRPPLKENFRLESIKVGDQFEDTVEHLKLTVIMELKKKSEKENCSFYILREQFQDNIKDSVLSFTELSDKILNIYERSYNEYQKNKMKG